MVAGSAMPSANGRHTGAVLPVGLARQHLVDGRIAGHRLDEVRRDDDHQLALLLVVVQALEEGADDGQIAQERHLVEVRQRRAAHQPADDEALAVAQLDHGVGAPRDDGRHGGAIERDAAAEVEVARLRGDFEGDAIFRQDGRRHREPDAERLVFDGGGAERLRHRDRDLAAGQEVRALPRQCHQARFGQHARHAVGLEQAQVRKDALASPRQEQVERRTDRHGRFGRQAVGVDGVLGQRRRRKRAEIEPAALAAKGEARLLEHRLAELDHAHVDLHRPRNAQRRGVDHIAALGLFRARGRGTGAVGPGEPIHVFRLARHDSRIALHADARVARHGLRGIHLHVVRDGGPALRPDHHAGGAGLLGDDEQAACGTSPLEQQGVGNVRIADRNALERLAEADLALAAGQQMQRLPGGRRFGKCGRCQHRAAQHNRAHPTANHDGFSHVAPHVFLRG
ncbi:hypothetical protein R76706_02161 [Ralstonia mannitolilytica]|nr:hypothetical protein R76706_02161 [Ralstonia mannitolilytica]